MNQNMMCPRSRSTWSLCELIARGLSLMVILLAVIVLIGWTFDLEMLKRLRPGFVAMNPMTAGLFLVGSTALLILSPARPSRWFILIGRICALVIVAIGVLRVTGYSIGRDVRVDRLLFSQRLESSDGALPNRMAPNTAASFIFAGAAILLLTVKRSQWRAAASLPALLALSGGMLTVIGYLNGVSSLSAVGSFIPMALHTAFAFIALSVAILMLSYVRAITDDRSESAVAGQELNENARIMERRAIVGFAAALVVMCVIGFAAFKSFEQFISASGWDTHTREVLSQIDALSLAIRDAETGERGYIITGNEEFLGPYRAAMQSVPVQLQQLRFLTADNPQQQQHLAELDRLVQARMETLRDITARRRDAGFEVARQLVESGHGPRLMQQIEKAIASMDAEEHRLLSLRSAATNSGARITIVVVIIGTVVGAFFVAISGCLVRRDMRARAQSERAMRLAKASAEDANSAKSQFLAHMSHEIRTPLNGVIGMLDLLAGTALTEQQLYFAKLAKSSAESLTTVINDILDFSKIEAGKMEIVQSDINLHHTVEEVMEVLAQKAAGKGLKLASHTDPRVPALVRADGDRIRQVLINLVNNAIKFTEQGSVILRVTVDGDSNTGAIVRFTVSDTGIGIAPDRYERLFKSFSQADASTTRVYGGTGLGLAISKQLVELMGGEIGVESHVAKGSTFWFTVAVECQEDGHASSQVPRLDPRGIRVLAVDDDERHREVLREQIKSWGLDAATAQDGESALQMLTDAAAASAPFRVAIIDSDVPNMDACELAAAVKARANIHETVLMILLSVEANISNERLRQMGFAGHMTKPVRQSQLFNAIMDAIAASKQDPSPAMIEQVPSKLQSESQAPTQFRILLAEDNEVNQVVGSKMLARSGYGCDIVANGRLAVEAVKARCYDLVLMDCQMPELDGFDATCEIRRLEASGHTAAGPGAHVPIIALTANAMKGDREKCLAAGMDSYASKPINPEKLIAAVRGLLKQPDERRAA